MLVRVYLKSGGNFAVRVAWMKWNQRKNGQFIGVSWKPLPGEVRIATIDPRQIEALVVEDEGPTIN